MLILNSFLFCGVICMIAQILLDNTKLTPGHITSLFVIIGAFLDTFHIYDKLIQVVGGGAQLPIMSFGHSLTHAVMEKVEVEGFFGLFTGMFDLTSAGISGAILFSFVFTLLFRPKD